MKSTTFHKFKWNVYANLSIYLIPHYLYNASLILVWAELFKSNKSK